MRPRLQRILACLAVLTAASIATGQDFDPRGRKKPPAGRPPVGKPPAGRPPGQPGTPTQPGTTTQPKPAENAIERQTRIVLLQPAAAVPLQRLAQTYRERDGNIQALVKDFETRAAAAQAAAGAATPEQIASVIALAGVYRIDGRPEEAIKTYEKAIAMRSTDPSAILALARLFQDRGDLKPASERYEQALALQTVKADREQTIRTLMTLALDAKDFAKAKEHHDRLVKLDPTNLFVRAELGRELYSRAEYARAEVELEDLVKHAAGDNRTLAPALKDLGKAQAKAHKNAAALATLKRALAAAGAEAAVRAEIYETVTEIYRADQQLPVLVKQLEDEHPTDFARLALLGSLYEETGDPGKALAVYRRALAVNPRHIDVRIKMIRVLQAQGEIDKAIAEYEGLIRAAPNNPAFVFEQCEALLQRGDRTRALRLLGELEARAGGDEDTLSRLATFYGKMGESDRSLKILTRLTQVAASDPSHLVDLGDRYYQEGNHALAVQTWKRILVTVTPRARALAALGEVLMEHEMTQDALAAFKEAVQLEPGTVAYKKQLAWAYERVRSHREARSLWQEIAEHAKKPPGDRLLAREARGRIVQMWSLEKMLDAQLGPLSNQFNAATPDLDAGRLLAEAQLHARKLDLAEATLRRLVALAPGDVDAYLGLERVLVQQNKVADAILVLEKLLAVEPKQARQIYQRMAQYALQLYRDDDAIKYAARAVELAPDDAEGHHRLGEMYRQRQDVERAIQQFRAAIAKNDRLFVVYFELADLLLSRQETEEADRLFRRVIRGAPDEELVSRAARLSLQINLGKGTLESLEQELLPLAIGNPQRPIYRRLLVQIYDGLTFALVQRVRHGQGKDADEARAQLRRIGNRAVKPLLDALADADPSQQRIAIEVLAYVENRNAGMPLYAYATGPGETHMRTRAMVACGALRDPGMLPRLTDIVFPRRAEKGAAKEQELEMASDTVAVAAAWGIARLGDRKALPTLERIAQSGTPEMRAFALLGLAGLKERREIPLMVQTARALDAGSVARAAAAYALGELGAEGEASTLLTMAEGTDRLAREAALIALARMGATRGEAPGGKAAAAAMADAVFAGGEDARGSAGTEALRRTGAAALVILATRQRDEREVLPVPDNATLDAEAALRRLTARSFGPKERAATLVAYGDVLGRAATGALSTSSDRAHAVLDALGTADGDFLPLLDREVPSDGAARDRARELARILEPSIVPLVRHPDASLRTKAIVVLSRSSTDAGTGAIASALADPSEAVQRVALAAVGDHPDPRTLAATAKIAQKHDNWAVRLLAVQALGRLGAKGKQAEAAAILADVTRQESYALVREGALRAIASFDGKAAAKIAEEMARKEPEPRVRDYARQILGQRP